MKLPRDIEAAVLATPGVEVRGAMPLAAPPPDCSEKAFDAAVVALAKAAGWTLTYHTRDSRGSNAGFPDRIFARPGRLIACELKSAAGRPTAAQLAWLEAFRAGGCEAYLFRPGDWAQVVEVLVR